MSSKKTCPVCGFTAHAICSDGNGWTYTCERCGAIFE